MLTWRAAMQESLYGPRGFYRRPEGPGAHFRTSVHASALFAVAAYELARQSGLSTIIDMGAGGGELLHALHEIDSSLHLVGVEVSGRPPTLPSAIEWAEDMPPDLTALVIANEWLDNIPVDVVELAEDGPCLIHVDHATGEEQRGSPPPEKDLDWLRRWWPLEAVGDRAEVGWTREQAWASVVARLRQGIAVAVDYGHTAESRPPQGTLAAYRHGRAVPVVPDGSRDITAHVAIDSCAAAGVRAGARTIRLTTQREALRSLGIDGRRPARALAYADPGAYVQALSRASEAAELLDPAGLGGFFWLEQRVGADRGP